MIACTTSPASATERASAPTLSSDQQSAIAPVRATRPKLGRRPTVPQRAAGATIEPIVSVPIANEQSPSATAAALPADDPDEPSSGFHGLRVRPPNQMSP